MFGILKISALKIYFIKERLNEVSDTNYEVSMGEVSIAAVHEIFTDDYTKCISVMLVIAFLSLC